MVFLFNDKGMTLKHLCFIIEAKKLNANTLRIKESVTKSSLNEDLLYYSKESILSKDIKRLKNALEEYTRYVNDMQKQQQMGFQGAVGDELPPDDCGDEGCGGEEG